MSGLGDEITQRTCEALRELDDVAEKTNVDIPDFVANACAGTIARVVAEFSDHKNALVHMKLLIAVTKNCYRAGFARGVEQAQASIGRG